MQNNRTYSPSFVNRWKDALVETYNYDVYMDFIVQKTITAKKCLSYLPFINYTDRTNEDIEDLLELAKDQLYQIRVLDFQYQDFKQYDPVTMRLDLKGKTIEEIRKNYSKSVRRRVKVEDKFVLYALEDKKYSLNDFYQILKIIFKNHGTPLFPKRYFENLLKHLQGEIYFLEFEDRLVGGTFVLFDPASKIATLQYGGILPAEKNYYNGYMMDHLIIKRLLEDQEYELLDYGRTPYETGSYQFKRSFGSYPVKIDIVTNMLQNNQEIYHKYDFAANVWRKLPYTVTDSLGAKLTKYLVEL